MANTEDAKAVLIPAMPDVPTKICQVCGYGEEECHAMTAPCGHTYCSGCINEFFDNAAKHEISPPPKCCGQIMTLENAGSFLISDTYGKFPAKSEEVSATNRTYRSDFECSTFIPLKAIDDRQAKCPGCQKLTCIVCKKEAHGGDCLEDPAVEYLMTAAAEAGFQQCQNCKRVIELSAGC